MAFLDKALQLGKKVGETTASVAKSAAAVAREKSEQAIEIGKLSKDILVENGKINKLYEDVGKHAFDIYNSSKDFSLLDPLFLQIAGGFARIEECKAKIEEVKRSSGSDDDGDVLPEDGVLPAEEGEEEKRDAAENEH